MPSPANDHEALATRAIEHGIDRAERLGTGIDLATARLIAATLHDGPGSELEAFAATAVLDSAAAFLELNALTEAEASNERWVTALAEYIAECAISDIDEGTH